MSGPRAMMGGGSASGLSGLLKDGYKHFSGTEEAVMRNIDAVQELSRITRTSLGPNGMNKLVINHLEKVLVTSDTGTIVTELEVVHPAAKMITMAAKMQEAEVGDGTNFVVSFAGELLKGAEEMLRTGLHISDIVDGYAKALAKVEEELESLVVESVEDARNVDALVRALRPVIAAKQYGLEELLAPLVGEACVSVMPPEGRVGVNVDSVRVAKLIGGSVSDSTVIRGYVALRSVEGVVRHVRNAKVAVFGCGIESAGTETKGTVVLRSAEELLEYNRGEEKMMEESVRAIAESGANVVVANGSISEMAQHFLDKFELLTVKITSKWELRRLCRAVGATAVGRVGAPMPDEMGECDEVTVREVGSRLVTVFRQSEERGALATVLLRGSTMGLLEDVERAVDDAVNTAKTVAVDGRMLAGAGATEIELAHRVAQYGAACPGLEQYAIKRFGEALEVVPRTLAENAGRDATEVVSSLYAAHAGGAANAGVNIDDGGVLDAVAEGVLDSYVTKRSAIKLAVDAALTVLRVDQIIMAKQAGGPAPRAPGAPDA